MRNSRDSSQGRARGRGIEGRWRNQSRHSTSGPPRDLSNSHSQKQSPSSPQDWSRWPELKLLLDGLPKDVGVKHILQWFSHEGNIHHTKVYDDYDNKDMARAYVIFSPPPVKPFWESGVRIVSHPNYSKTHPNGIRISMRLSEERRIEGRERNLTKQGRVYPQHLKLDAKCLSFGTLVDYNKMKILKELQPLDAQPRSLRIEFNANSKRLEIFFPFKSKDSSGRGTREFKCVIEVTQIKKVFYQSLDRGDSALVLHLASTPQYFWKDTDFLKRLDQIQKVWYSSDFWNRATDVAEDLQESLRYPVALHNRDIDPNYMEIGRWTTLRVDLVQEHDNTGASLSQQLQWALEDANIIYNTSEFEFTAKTNEEDMWTHLDHPPALGSSAATIDLMQMAHTKIYLSPEIRYQLEACVSRGVLNEHTVTAEFLTKVAETDRVKARHLLEYILDEEEPLYDPMTLFQNQDAAAYYPNARLPHYCTLVRRVSVTPTTIRMSTPSAEASNRILREYKHIQDRFIRVQFIEESEKSKVGQNKKGQSDANDAIYNRIMRTLYHGIRIGDRCYEFLAFGNSQLRECGAYFFCPTEHTSCEDIRQWMGQFDHIKVVAKYAARLGQCFSTTREIRGISAPQIEQIEDVERNGFCFSDGVGKMSDFVARFIIDEMKMDVFEEPTAFQFRMGGCKGLLTVWPEVTGTKVLIRDSQKKFESRFNKLEIIRCAKPATATLNRQTITILENLGVPTAAFLKLLDHQLKQIERAMNNTNEAISLLTRQVDENQTTLTIAELLKAGFIAEERREPFVTSILNLWRSWSLKLLKEKARIEVDQSAFVLGCLDESGSLRGHDISTEGSKKKEINKLPQIFLQISDPRVYRKTTIIEGICIVGRNPSLHPGDIRVVQAVDEPKLHHLKDVVVFPRGGDRPVPNMLSGGDLDGDDFFVIWNRDMIPTEWNHPPMNYAGIKPKMVDSGVTVDDLRDFFVSYIKNDCLPLVATSHLAFADANPDGPRSAMCLELADMHSQAVDFPKTGVPVNWEPRFQPRKWPHFMEKKNSYRSKKTLGVIYDKVSRQPIQFTPDWESDFDKRITERFEVSNEVLSVVEKIKSEYDTAVRRLLTQHNIKTEFELWTGFAMSRPAIGSDYKMQELLGREYEVLKQRFRELCYEKAGGNSPDKIDPFVAAMYKVTETQLKNCLAMHDENQTERSGVPDELSFQSLPFITFPWIFHWIMIRIALGGKYNPKTSILAASKREKEFQGNSETSTGHGEGPGPQPGIGQEKTNDISRASLPGISAGEEDSSSQSSSEISSMEEVKLQTDVSSDEESLAAAKGGSDPCHAAEVALPNSAGKTNAPELGGVDRHEDYMQQMMASGEADDGQGARLAPGDLAQPFTHCDLVARDGAGDTGANATQTTVISASEDRAATQVSLAEVGSCISSTEDSDEDGDEDESPEDRLIRMCA